MKFKPNLVRIYVLIGMLMLVFGGCGSKNELENYRVKKIKDGNFELSIAVRKGDFRVGKKIPINISVKNVGREIEFLHYSTQQRFDVEVKDSNQKPVWRWSQGQFFAMVLAEERLKPDDSGEYHATWSQKDAAGNQVAPGKYTITGKITADETSKIVSIDVKIVK